MPFVTGRPPRCAVMSQQVAAPISSVPASNSALGSSRRLTLIATILGSSIAILDSSVVSVALPSIQREPRRRPCGPAVGQQRLPTHAWLPDPARRIARRHLRRAADLRARRRRFRCRLAAVRAGADDRPAGRVSRSARRRRCPADAKLAGGDRRNLPRARARPCDRHLDRMGNDRRGARSVGRGGDSERRLVALDLRHQRAARGRLPVADPAGDPAGPERRRARRRWTSSVPCCAFLASAARCSR